MLFKFSRILTKNLPNTHSNLQFMEEQVFNCQQLDDSLIDEHFLQIMTVYSVHFTKGTLMTMKYPLRNKTFRLSAKLCNAC